MATKLSSSAINFVGKIAVLLPITAVLWSCQVPQQTADAYPAASVSDVLRTVAATSQASHNYIAAVNYHQSLYARDPDDLDNIVGLARNLRYVGAATRALDVLRRGLAKHPEHIELRAEYGKALIASGHHGEAVSALAQVREAAPDNWRAISALGIAYDMLGDHRSAQAAYQAALAVSPDNSDILNNLALSKALSGDLDGGVAILKRLTAYTDPGPQVRQNLALMYAMEGEMDLTERLVKRDLSNDMARQNLAYYQNLSSRVEVRANTLGDAMEAPFQHQALAPQTAPTATASSVAIRPVPEAAPMASVLPPEPAATPVAPAAAPGHSATVVSQAVIEAPVGVEEAPTAAARPVAARTQLVRSAASARSVSTVEPIAPEPADLAAAEPVAMEPIDLTAVAAEREEVVEAAGSRARARTTPPKAKRMTSSASPSKHSTVEIAIDKPRGPSGPTPVTAEPTAPITQDLPGRVIVEVEAEEAIQASMSRVSPRPVRSLSEMFGRSETAPATVDAQNPPPETFDLARQAELPVPRAHTDPAVAAAEAKDMADALAAAMPEPMEVPAKSITEINPPPAAEDAPVSSRTRYRKDVRREAPAPTTVRTDAERVADVLAGVMPEPMEAPAKSIVAMRQVRDSRPEPGRIVSKTTTEVSDRGEPEEMEGSVDAAKDGSKRLAFNSSVPEPRAQFDVAMPARPLVDRSALEAELAVTAAGTERLALSAPRAPPPPPFVSPAPADAVADTTAAPAEPNIVDGDAEAAPASSDVPVAVKWSGEHLAPDAAEIADAGDDAEVETFPEISGPAKALALSFVARTHPKTDTEFGTRSEAEQDSPFEAGLIARPIDPYRMDAAAVGPDDAAPNDVIVSTAVLESQSPGRYFTNMVATLARPEHSGDVPVAPWDPTEVTISAHETAVADVSASEDAGTMAAAVPEMHELQIQLGIFPTQVSAAKWLVKLRRSHVDTLSGLRFEIAQVDDGKAETGFRLLAGPVASEAGASDLCARLDGRGNDCMLVNP